MQTLNKPLETTKGTSIRKMHQIVWVFLGIFGLFVITFSTALWRASQKDKFPSPHPQSFPTKGELEHCSSKNP
jgi:hypothetical protein